VWGAGEAAAQHRATITLFPADQGEEHGIEERRVRSFFPYWGFAPRESLSVTHSLRSWSGSVLPLAVSREEIVRRGLGFMVHDKQVMTYGRQVTLDRGEVNFPRGDVTLPRGPPTTNIRVSLTLNRGDITLPRGPPTTNIRVSVTLNRGDVTLPRGPPTTNTSCNP
jgi:hypothetical protein